MRKLTQLKSRILHISAIFFVLSALHGAAHAQTLSETIDLAIQHSSALRQRGYQNELAKIEEYIIQKKKRAAIDFHLQGGYGQVGTGGSKFVQSGVRYPLSAILDGSYSIDIWSGDKLDHNIGNKTSKQSAYDTAFLENKTILDAVDIYAALARGNIQRNTQQNLVNILTRKVEEAKKQFAVGVYTQPYVQILIGEKIEAESLLIEYESALAVDSLKFLRLTGQQPKNIDQSINIPDFPQNISEIHDQIDQAPQIRSLRSAFEIAQMEAERKDIPYRPSLKLIGNVGAQEGSIYLAERIYNYEIMLRFDYPLNNGALRSTEKSKSQAIISLRQEELKDTRELLELQTMQLIKQYQSASAQEPLLMDILSVKEKKLDATAKEAEAGKSTELEVMNGQQEKSEAENRLLLNRNAKALIAYQIRGLLGIASNKSVPEY